MCNSDRRRFLAISLVAVGAGCIAGAALAAETAPKKVYVCPPCGCAADGKEFSEPGPCPECGMPLVEKKAEPEKPAPQDGGGALMARQNRAAPRPPRTGKARPQSRQPSLLS